MFENKKFLTAEIAALFERKEYLSIEEVIKDNEKA